MSLHLGPAGASATLALGNVLDEGHLGTPVAGGVLDISADAGEFVVGPWQRAGEPGCRRCAAMWRENVSGLHSAPGGSPASEQRRWADVAELMAEQGLDNPQDYRRSIRVLEYRTGTVLRYSFVPHPGCPQCGPGDLDSSTALELDTAQPTVAGQLRVRTYAADQVAEALTDRRHGPVAHAYRDEQSPLSLLTAEIVAPGRSQREGGYGRSASFGASKLPAYLEACERILGGYRHPGVPIVEGSYAELADVAVDPASLGLHDEQAMDHPGFELQRYSPHLSTSWVWAHSTRDGVPRLIPEHVAYWHASAEHPRFLYETSSGCAVGGSLEEAALYGYFEAVERDAFLLAWYSRMRLPLITGAAADPVVAHLADQLEEHGLELRLLDMTTDFNVPTALAVITASDELVASGKFPALSLASAAHLQGRKAIRTALEECATNVLMYRKWKSMRPSVDVARCRGMLEDHNLVRTLEDHTGLHGLSEARELNEFLRHPAGEITVEEFCGSPGPTNDLAAVLQRQLDTVHALGMDLLVVDQSAPYLSDAVAHNAAKVLVPGTMPMTFGHLNRRLEGLPRLQRASQILKGGTPWHNSGAIHPLPHPFP